LVVHFCCIELLRGCGCAQQLPCHSWRALAVTVDGQRLVRDTALDVQNFTYQGSPDVVVQWAQHAENNLPGVNITVGARAALPSSAAQFDKGRCSPLRAR